MRPTLLYTGSIIYSLVAFPLTPEYWPGLTITGHFTLNSVFAQVLLEFFCVDFENNCIKLTKINLYFQQEECVPGTLVSGNINFICQVFASRSLWSLFFKFHWPVKFKFKVIFRQRKQGQQIKLGRATAVFPVTTGRHFRACWLN